MAAHGVSRGIERIKGNEQGSGEGARHGLFLSPHPGLGDFLARFPRLTPWAILCRCSAAISTIFAMYQF
jgi:hypothetical protein